MKIKSIVLLLLLLIFKVDAQINLKIYGQKILDNKVKPTDDKNTFQLIDSLFCKNKTNQDFYFNVFNKIQQISDGALSEYVSIVASKYYFINNTEFIKKSKKMTTKAIYQWLDHVAFELYINCENGEKDLPKIKKKIMLLENKFLTNSEEKTKCKTFNDYLYRKAVDEIKVG